MKRALDIALTIASAPLWLALAAVVAALVLVTLESRTLGQVERISGVPAAVTGVTCRI